MNSLIESEINKIYQMNQDLLSDGIVPQSINNYEYLVNYYIECEEMEPKLATVLVESILESWDNYVDHFGLMVGTKTKVDNYYQINIMDSEGVDIVHFCYLISDQDTPVLLLKALYQKHKNILWID